MKIDDYFLTRNYSLLVSNTDKSKEMKDLLQKEKNFIRESMMIEKLSQKIDNNFENIQQSKSLK